MVLDPTPTRGDAFGWSVALRGNYALVGAPGDSTNGDLKGQAHLFDAGSGKLLQTFDDPGASLGNEFGISVAFDGTQLLIGSPQDSTVA